MTAKDLIDALAKADPRAVVKAFDPESNQVEEVTGITYGGRDLVVELFTDSDDESERQYIERLQPDYCPPDEGQKQFDKNDWKSDIERDDNYKS